MRARRAGVGFQQSVQAEPLASRAQQGQQRGGKGADQQQAVTPHRLADAGRRQPHAELQVLDVAELRLDSPALGGGAPVVHSAGYSLLSFTRAFAVVKCQSALACLPLRTASQAWTSSFSTC